MMGWLGAAPLGRPSKSRSRASSTTFHVCARSFDRRRDAHQCGLVGAGERARQRPIGLQCTRARRRARAGFSCCSTSRRGGTIAGWFVHDAAVITLAAQLLVVAALFSIFRRGRFPGQLNFVSEQITQLSTRSEECSGFAEPAAWRHARRVRQTERAPTNRTLRSMVSDINNAQTGNTEIPRNHQHPCDRSDRQRSRQHYDRASPALEFPRLSRNFV